MFLKKYDLFKYYEYSKVKVFDYGYFRAHCKYTNLWVCLKLAYLHRGVILDNSFKIQTFSDKFKCDLYITNMINRLKLKRERDGM